MASQEVLTALEVLEKELAKLEPAIKHVETAVEVTKIVKEIPQKHVDLLKQVKDNDEKYKKELNTLFEKELSSLTEENKKLQKTTEEIQKQVKLEQEALDKLRETIKSFHDRIEKINFPERLDKLDANVAGIIAGIHSVLSRIEGLERNITDRLRDILDYQKEARFTLQSELEQSKTALQTAVDTAAKKQQTLTYITWALVAVAIIITFVLKK